LKIKRFFAKDIRAALDEIKITLGPDAIIMSNKNVEGGVEIVAAIDEDNNAVIDKPEVTSHSPETTLENQRAAFTNQEKTDPLESNSWDATGRLDKEFNDDQVSLSGFQQRLIKQQAQQTASELPEEKESNFSTSQSLNNLTLEDDAPSWTNQVNTNQGFNQADNLRDSVQQVNISDNSQVIDELRQEMASMRHLLQHQVGNLVEQDASRRDPVRQLIVTELIKFGFQDNVAQQLVINISSDASLEQAKETLVLTMLDRITSTSNDVLEQGGVVALVGPTGVGKTTTVAKLAARFAMRYGPDQVAMITTDSYRIGAYEQLNTYGKIMGCPVQVAKDAQQLADAIYMYRNKRLVLIDTAGMGQRDVRLNEQLTTLMSSSHVAIRSYIVLPATAQRQVLEEAIVQFRKIPLAGSIITKMDEAIGASEILSVAIGNTLPIGYLTNGQRVPEDIGVADIKKLIRSVVDKIGIDIPLSSTSEFARFK